MAQNELRSDKVVILPHEEALLDERPRVRFKRALFSFIIIIVILGVVYLATPLSRLGVVYFEGLNSLTRSDLISLIDIDEDELFLSIRLSEVQESIESHPVVSQANVRRAWMNRIHIEVIEHEVGACALVEGEMFHILTDGEVLHESVGMRANCDEMMIHGLTQEEVDAGVLGLFVRQLMRVDSEIRDLIQLIEHEPRYGDIYRFSLSMIDGNVVKVTTHTIHDYLNLYFEFVVELEPGQTGTLHLDVGAFFEPHQ